MACLYHPFRGRSVASLFFMGQLRPDAARHFSAGQQRILKAVYGSGIRDLVITCVNRNDSSGSYHYYRKKSAIDFGVTGQHIALNRVKLWNLYFYLKDRLGWSGGVGIGAPGNPHIHVDTRTMPFYFFELTRRLPIRVIELSRALKNLPILRRFRYFYTGRADPDPGLWESMFAQEREQEWGILDYALAAGGLYAGYWAFKVYVAGKTAHTVYKGGRKALGWAVGKV